MVAASVHAALLPPMDAQMHTSPPTPRQIVCDGSLGLTPMAPICSRPWSSPGEGFCTLLGALQQLRASIAHASCSGMAVAAFGVPLRPRSLISDFSEGAKRQRTFQSMDSQPSSTVVLLASQLRLMQPHLPLALGPALPNIPA